MTGEGAERPGAAPAGKGGAESWGRGDPSPARIARKGVPAVRGVPSPGNAKAGLLEELQEGRRRGEGPPPGGIRRGEAGRGAGRGGGCAA